MVLGFGRGPERFPSAKEQTPGPGAYDPKDLETKLPLKSGFLTGERFAGTSEELEGNPERSDPSPPRERKPVNPGNDRSYSWATQRIHELNKEVEAANKRTKELEKQLKERVDRTDKVKKELAAVTEARDQLLKKLQDQDQELVQVNGELSVTKQKLAEVSAQEAKASKSAQAGALRVEQLVVELKQATEVRKQLEQQHAALLKDADDDRQKADMALAELTALTQQLDAVKSENQSLCGRIVDLEGLCRQQAGELSEQKAKRAAAEDKVASTEDALAATRGELQLTVCALTEAKADAARTNEQAERLGSELSVVKAESADRGQQLGAVRLELAAAHQQHEQIASQLRTKEESMEALRAELLTQTSRVIELTINVSNLGSELEMARTCIQQRDDAIAGLKARGDELVQQLSDRSTELRQFETSLQLRNTELEAAAMREQELAACKARLEDHLAQKVMQHDQQVEAAVGLQQQLEAVQAALAAKEEAVTSAREKLDAAQAIITQQTRDLEAQVAVLCSLKGEVAALSAAAEDQMRDHSAAVSQLKEQLSSKEREACQLATQLADARALLQQRAEETAQLTLNLMERDATINFVQKKMDDLQADVAGGDKQITALRCELQDLRASANGLEETLAGLRVTLATRDATIAGLERDVAETKAAVQERDGRIMQLRNEAEAAANTAVAADARIKALGASLEAAKVETETLNSQVSTLETDIAALQSELSTQRETSAGLSVELAASQTALDDGKARERALREDLSSMEAQLASAEVANQQAQQHCTQLNNDLAGARAAQLDLARRHDELVRGEAELRATLQTRQEQHEHERACLQAELAAVKAELVTKLEALTLEQQEAHVLRARLQDAYTSAEKQNAELAQAQADLAERSATISELHRKIEDLEQKATELEAGKADTVHALSFTKQELSDRAALCNALNGRVAELDTALADLTAQRARLDAIVAEMQAEKLEACAKAKADADQASARIAALEGEVAESQGAAERLGVELAQLVTDLEEREQEIRELKVARHETSSALTAVTAERADLHSQLEAMRRRDIDMQEELATARARVSQLDAEAQSLQALVSVAQEEARNARDEACAMSADLDKARGQIRTLHMQEVHMDSLRQELEGMCMRLRDSEARKEVLQNQVMAMEGQLASMTPIISKARLDDQVRALSDALEKSHLRSNELEGLIRRNSLLETTASSELRRLTDENEHLVTRMMKLEDDLKEQSGLGHNNHKQKIQYHLRLKLELEELRHECTVLLREKFQLEQCIRYLAVQVGMGPSDRRPPLATAERKAIEKVLPACLTYNAMYTTPLSQRVMRLSARGKNNEQGTVYAGGKETFEEGINEAKSKFFSAAQNLQKDVQLAAAALTGSSPVADRDGMDVDEGPTCHDGATRSDTCGSPDGKASRDMGGAFGTPVATIRGAGTPASGSTLGTVNVGVSQTLAKLEERIKQLISDVCAPGTLRNAGDFPDSATAVADLAAPALAAPLTTARTGAGAMRDRDQDKAAKDGSSWGGASSNGSGGSNGGAKCERASRPALTAGVEASRANGAQNRRLTVAPSVRTTFKP